MDSESFTRTKIPFNRPTYTGDEDRYVLEAIAAQKIGPGGAYVAKCRQWLTSKFAAPLVLPTGSCTAALEMSAMLVGIKPGDEVILPSFAYPSTAAAFARAGAELVFVDIDPATMNIDPDAARAAVTRKTKAVVVLHYAGIACDMDRIGEITGRGDIAVIEDAALAFLAKHRGRMCGTLSAVGCFSFHESKTIHCGQGGALIVNDPEMVGRAEVILEKGTDRSKFLRGEVDRYSWQDIGSSYALENLRAAFLFAQLRRSEPITESRAKLWRRYHDSLARLEEEGFIGRPAVADEVELNGHLYWVKAADEAQRDELIQYLAAHGVHAVFHYVPLHSSEAGRRYGRFAGEDRHTTREAARLLRLPMFHGLNDVERVVDRVGSFFGRG